MSSTRAPNKTHIPLLPHPRLSTYWAWVGYHPKRDMRGTRPPLSRTDYPSPPHHSLSPLARTLTLRRNFSVIRRPDWSTCGKVSGDFHLALDPSTAPSSIPPPRVFLPPLSYGCSTFLPLHVAVSPTSCALFPSRLPTVKSLPLVYNSFPFGLLAPEAPCAPRLPSLRTDRRMLAFILTLRSSLEPHALIGALNSDKDPLQLSSFSITEVLRNQNLIFSPSTLRRPS